MKYELSHPSCGGGSEQGLEHFTEDHRAEQLPDCILFLGSARNRDGDAPSSASGEEGFSTVSLRKSCDGVCGRSSKR